MTIAGLAVGATRGYIYLRSEYPDALVRPESRPSRRAHRGAAGSGRSVRGQREGFRSGSAGRCRRLHLRRRDRDAREPRGQARDGALQAAASRHRRASSASRRSSTTSSPSRRSPIILDKGADFYRDYGMGRSRGTLPFQLAGNIKHGGLVEKAFGVTLRELLYDYGGGSLSGRPIRAVQVGGPLGAFMPESQFDTAARLRGFRRQRTPWSATAASSPSTTPWTWPRMARYAMEFCAIESCGKCTPCRIGSTRGVEVIDRMLAARRARIRRPRREYRAAQGPVRHDDRRLALRAGRHGPVPGAERRSSIFPRTSVCRRRRSTAAGR